MITPEFLSEYQRETNRLLAAIGREAFKTEAEILAMEEIARTKSQETLSNVAYALTKVRKKVVEGPPWVRSDKHQKVA